MTKIRKIIAGFVGSMLIGSVSSAASSTLQKSKVESKIHNVIKALHARKVQGEQSKRTFEYLEKNHNLRSIDFPQTNTDQSEMNSGNWKNWSNWDTWSNYQ